MVNKPTEGEKPIFDVDEFMAKLGVKQVTGYFAQNMDAPEAPYQIYEGVSKYGANVVITIRDSNFMIEVTFGSFKTQSMNEELSIRKHFSSVINSNNLFFSSGNDFLIVSLNHCSTFTPSKGFDALINNSIELVPMVSSLLSQYRNFTPFIKTSSGVIQ